jgi:uncharacterized membrane protein
MISLLICIILIISSVATIKFISLHRRVELVEHALTTLKKSMPTVTEDFSETLPARASPTAEVLLSAPVEESIPVVTDHKKESTDNHGEQWAQASVTSQQPSKFDGLLVKLWKFIAKQATTGNIPAKLGILILLVGVAFLLKYTAQYTHFPIGARLVLCALGGVTLIALGWFWRDRKQQYGLILQGGGIGLLYLIIFISYSEYGLITASFTLALLLTVVLLSAMIALLQNSLILIVLAEIGGFAAPLLASNPNGSYVMLFSYYAILNLAIALLVWFKPWRILSNIGFISTFLVTGLWGFNQYQSNDYLVSQGFLIFFILLYVFIAIIFSYQKIHSIKENRDTFLIFSVPIIGFSIQSTLVNNYHDGYALSALAFGLFYVALGWLLLWLSRSKFRFLIESFLALAVLFLTLTIALAFNQRWTGLTFSLEGLLAVWFGVRQNHFLLRLFGMVLTVITALISLNLAIDIGIFEYQNSPDIVFDVTLISLVTLIAACVLNKNSSRSYAWEKYCASLFLCIGLLETAAVTLVYFNDYEHYVAGLIYLIVMSAICWILAEQTRWKLFQSITLRTYPLICIYGLCIETRDLSFIYINFAWLLLLAFGYTLLYRCEKTRNDLELPYYHILFGWLVILRMAILIVHGLLLLNLELVWSVSACGLLLIILVHGLDYAHRSIKWPFQNYLSTYKNGIYIPLIGIVFFWPLIANFFFWDLSQNIVYIPIINPLDLVIAFSLLAICHCYKQEKERIRSVFPSLNTQLFFYIPLGLWSLVWLTSMVFRACHAWFFVAYTPTAMYQSVLVQTTLTLVWALTAFIMILIASRYKFRQLWIAGGCLLLIVVIKLFLVDLAQINTLARIISFIGVGGLLLLIGYFSEIPPKQPAQEISL